MKTYEIENKERPFYILRSNNKNAGMGAPWIISYGRKF